MTSVEIEVAVKCALKTYKNEALAELHNERVVQATEATLTGLWTGNSIVLLLAALKAPKWKTCAE